jgi:hypothetical protein
MASDAYMHKVFEDAEWKKFMEGFEEAGQTRDNLQVYWKKDDNDNHVVLLHFGMDPTMAGHYEVVGESRLRRGGEYGLEDLEGQGWRCILDRGERDKIYGLGDVRLHLNRMNTLLDERFTLVTAYRHMELSLDELRRRE